MKKLHECQHGMIDLETLDTKPSAVIVSVGLVLFTMEGISFEKEWILNLDEQVRLGRTISPSTVKFWLEQNEQARGVFKQPYCSLELFRQEFGPFVSGLNMWSNGPDFDTTIVMDLFHNQFNARAPWSYSNVRCFRTLNAITNCKDQVERRGTHHNALDDARYQAECVIWALKNKL